MINKRWRTVAFTTVLALIVACNKQPVPGAVVIDARTYAPSEGAVDFELEPDEAITSGSQRYRAIHRYDREVARFVIELGPADGRTQGTSGFPNGFLHGEGKLVRSPDSESEHFLDQLKGALEARTVPSNVKKANEIHFQYVILGEHQSHDSKGGFSNRPLGGWVAMKLFLDNDAEVFLNLNRMIGKGEFSIKDSDYGDDVLAEIAKIL